MTTSRKIFAASARWDTDTDPENPGWVVDVQFSDGGLDTFVPAPSVYYEDQDADVTRIVAETVKWEGLEYDPPLRDAEAAEAAEADVP